MRKGCICAFSSSDAVLVLQACGIPYFFLAIGGQECIYVPPVLEARACAELGAYARECLTVPAPADEERASPHAFLSILGLLPLVLWHGWRTGWWDAPSFLPDPGLWARAGMLDSVRIRLFHEWYRLACALTLHADVAHLWSNVAFGSIFLGALSRVAGVGRALWLSVLGGTVGNGLSLLLRPTESLSLGFSTALFAGIGALAGHMAVREGRRKPALLSVAAGTALLALLGTEGETTDVLAHCCGLACGLVLGCLEGARSRGRLPMPGQIVSALAAFLLPAGAWWWAFSRL